MLKYENHCCGCSSPAYPCRGSRCPNRRVEVTYCDHCDEAIAPGDIYIVDGEDLCEECLLDMFRKG